MNKGQGVSYLRCRIAHIYEAGIPAIGIDPHPDNKRAIRAYEKLGFKGGKERIPTGAECCSCCYIGQIGLLKWCVGECAEHGVNGKVFATVFRVL